jgi:hypothetical protein
MIDGSAFRDASPGRVTTPDCRHDPMIFANTQRRAHLAGIAAAKWQRAQKNTGCAGCPTLEAMRRVVPNSINGVSERSCKVKRILQRNIHHICHVIS